MKAIDTQHINQKKQSAIIIGSGVASLATSIRLALQGFDVNVYEKNNYPGGKLSSFNLDGFHFDAGPSLFTQPQNIVELFEIANEPIEAYFDYHKIDIACKYFFENGKQINAFTNIDLLANELEQKVNESKSIVKEYLSNSEKSYNSIGNIFLNHPLHKRSTWFNPKALSAIKFLKLSYLTKTMAGYNTIFKAKETQQIFNRYATYNGSNPFKAPAMLSLIPHLEYNDGVYFPKGGMIEITNALYKLALKKGVIFHFNKNVQSIICPQNKAIGIVVDNNNIYSNIVISNSDIYFTYKNLLGNNIKATKVLKQERSSSAFVFYWGINKKFEELDLHNIFFTENYEQEFKNLFKLKKYDHDPTIYINITSKQDKSLAPANCENWFVMVNAPAIIDYDIETLKIELKKNIVKKLNKLLKTDIEKYIVCEQILHPQLMQSNTSSYLGSLYGTSSNSKMAAFLRHPNFSKEIKNLYCIGGSVHPGGGIPLCMASAKIVSNLIKHDLKIKAHV